MTSYALVERGRPRTPEAILLMVEDLAAAEDIAFELRRKDVLVDVVEIHAPRATE
jgi:hypothetical protein